MNASLRLLFAGWGVVASLAAGGTAAAALAAGSAPYEFYETRDPSVAAGTPKGGLLLLGGGEWPDGALQWFAEQAGRGHIVMISASGDREDHDELAAALGPVASVETLVLHDRASSNDARVLAILRAADGIFLHGGDQANYVRYWKGTPVAEVIEERFRSGRPVGGTSAGLAILGQWAYGALDGGSLLSSQALADPLGPAVTLVDDFLHLGPLKGVITDSHFAPRGRLGRLIVWVARLHAQGQDVTGLGIDESAGVEITADGIGQVISRSAAGGVTLVHAPRSATLQAATPFAAQGVRLVRVPAGGKLAVSPLRALGLAPATVLDLAPGAAPPVWP